VKHRTADEGDTADFGVLFIGYVADIDFQTTVGTAYGVTGGARDTKVRELLGWWNHLYYDALHWYEPATARGGHNESEFARPSCGRAGSVERTRLRSRSRR